MNLYDLINKLPLELVWKIQSYILKPQKKEILIDIKSFYKLRNLGLKLYTKRFENEPEQIENWFANDISIYMNDNFPSMYGYLNKYYDIFFRLKNIKNKQSILNISYNLSRGCIKREINVLFGLLTYSERINMLNNSFSKTEINEAISSLPQLENVMN